MFKLHWTTCGELLLLYTSVLVYCRYHCVTQKHKHNSPKLLSALGLRPMVLSWWLWGFRLFTLFFTYKASYFLFIFNCDMDNTCNERLHNGFFYVIILHFIFTLFFVRVSKGCLCEKLVFTAGHGMRNSYVNRLKNEESSSM